MIGQKYIWAAVGLAGLICGVASAAEGTIGRVPEPVPEQYIVVFKDEVANVPLEAYILSGEYEFETTHVYEHALKGFAARGMSEADALQLSLEPQVRYVQENGRLYLSQQKRPGPLEIDMHPDRYTWGLDRIDQRDLPLDLRIFNSPLTGAGVKAYVLDSGIRASHPDFGGRVIAGYTPIPPPYPNPADPTDDCLYHGTHVAGIIGGALWGMAKQVTLVPVKVSPNCVNSITVDHAIAGINWMVGDHLPGELAVANMSFGGEFTDQGMEDAVNGAIDDGIVVAIAALNQGFDACRITPARVPAALTVTGSLRTDIQIYNNGTCVDLVAPGFEIRSAWISGGYNGSTLSSGTSMAAPHAAGAAANYLQAHPLATPAEVNGALIDISTRNRLVVRFDTPNRLLYAPEAIAAPSAPLVNFGMIAQPPATRPYLTWADVGGATTHYVVQRRSFPHASWPPSGTWSDIAIVEASTQELTFTDKAIKVVTHPNDLVYYDVEYRVRAVNGGGPSGYQFIHVPRVYAHGCYRYTLGELCNENS